MINAFFQHIDIENHYGDYYFPRGSGKTSYIQTLAELMSMSYPVLVIQPTGYVTRSFDELYMNSLGHPFRGLAMESNVRQITPTLFNLQVPRDPESLARFRIRGIYPHDVQAVLVDDAFEPFNMDVFGDIYRATRVKSFLRLHSTETVKVERTIDTRFYTYNDLEEIDYGKMDQLTPTSVVIHHDYLRQGSFQTLAREALLFDTPEYWEVAQRERDNNLWFAPTGLYHRPYWNGP